MPTWLLLLLLVFPSDRIELSGAEAGDTPPRVLAREEEVTIRQAPNESKSCSSPFALRRLLLLVSLLVLAVVKLYRTKATSNEQSTKPGKQAPGYTRV
jgi:hypothetical protein